MERGRKKEDNRENAREEKGAMRVLFNILHAGLEYSTHRNGGGQGEEAQCQEKPVKRKGRGWSKSLS